MRTSRSAVPRSHRHLRLFFFSIASAWGFMVGAGAVLAMIRPDRLSLLELGMRLLWLAPAGVAAVVGGLVTGAAYREYRRRLR